jgi:hypothetical protein
VSPCLRVSVTRRGDTRERWIVAVVAIVALMWALPDRAFAQQRPLVTEDPETIGAGRILLEGGLDYAHDADYPASGLEGNLLRALVVGVSVGLSSIAEVQIDGGFHNRLDITRRSPLAPLASMVNVSGNSTTSVEDFVIGTKVRVVSEGVSRPGIGVRFATKLPNASNESGLGLDTTDFFFSLLVAKTVQSVRVVGNGGVGILGDPTRGDRQNDVLIYGLSFARAITQRAELVGEVHGHASTREGEPPPGTGSSSILRFGARYTTGPVRADAALLVGLTSRDPGWGVTAGFTYVFNAFQIP